MTALVIPFPRSDPEAVSTTELAWLEAHSIQVLLFVLGALVLLLLFLIGCAVVLRLRRQREEDRQNMLTCRWTPILNDILARRQPFTALDDAVDPGDTDDFLSFLRRRAMEASPTQLTWIRIVARPYLACSPDPSPAQTAEQRAYHVHQLGWLGSDDAEPALRAALDDPSSFVAMVALRALTRRHTARRASLSAGEKHDFAQFVVAHLPRFGAWRQKSLAVLLAQIDAIARPLRQLFANRNAATWVRALAGAALEKLEDPETAPLAVRILLRESTLPLQTAALRLLEAVGTHEHTPLLRQWRTADNEVLRIRALSALAHVDDASNVPLFEKALDDPSQWVARQAAFGLVRLGHEHALHTLANSAHPRAALAYQVLTRHQLAA